MRGTSRRREVLSFMEIAPRVITHHLTSMTETEHLNATITDLTARVASLERRLDAAAGAQAEVAMRLELAAGWRVWRPTLMPSV